jgi:methylglutaconyl-CoA hydratase
MYTLIQYHTEERIAFITLNRPEKRNALNSEMVRELLEAYSQAEDDPEVKVIVMQANGEVFSAGADLAYLQKLQTNSFEENLADSQQLGRLLEKIYTLKKIVIACVEGHAIAGGCGLATVCDLVYAANNAKFGYTESHIGFVPALVGVFLLRKLAESHAKELMYTGKLINAQEAYHIGLINGINERDHVRGFVKVMARQLCTEASAHSLMLTKQLVAEVQHRSVPDAMLFAAEMNAHARNSPDCKRGIGAFLAKEKISW